MGAPEEVLAQPLAEHRLSRFQDARERAWAWDPPVQRALRVAFPPLALLVGLMIAVVYSGELLKVVSFLVFYHLPLGMYTGVAAAAAMHLDVRVAVFIVILLHVFGGLFVTWNADALKTVPWLGAKVRRMEEKGRAKWEADPRLRDLGVVGVGVFTALPVPGTGLITGALLGRLLGLAWFPTFVAVAVGGMGRVLTITMIAYGLWSFAA